MARLMLYKKIHRQHLRKWRIGRKFRWYNEVYEITQKPQIDRDSIWARMLDISISSTHCQSRLLINAYGRFWLGVNIKWLD